MSHVQGQIQGPALFLAQFAGDEPPYDDIDSLAAWASGLGYEGLQIPAGEERCIDLSEAAASKAYCDDYRGRLAEQGVVPTELGAFMAGQVLAFHPAYEPMFEPFYPERLSGEEERVAWATEELKKVVRASAHLGTSVVPALSGGLAWPMVYPWPQRPDGLIDEAFQELAARWRPVLDLAAEHDISVAYELHPGSDVFDGATFERFLEATDHHPAVGLNYDASHFVLQQLDYQDFIRRYGDRIRGFHVKDAEFRPSGRQGVYGGYESWAGRAGRFRTPGDGQVDFGRVFTLLTEAGFDGWAVLEWEDAIKASEQGAREGAAFIEGHLIEAATSAFDDFAGGEADAEAQRARNRRALGLE
jgi:sugar phosphate isomerase/epimerase